MPALDVLLAPENLLVNVVCGLSVQFAYLALLARVLPPRSTRTFWTVEILYQGATMFLKALYPVPLRIAVGVFGSLVIPLFMLRGVCCVGWWCARCACRLRQVPSLWRLQLGWG